MTVAQEGIGALLIAAENQGPSLMPSGHDWGRADGLGKLCCKALGVGEDTVTH